MITVSIFALFILYTLACIADGQDVKPIWKRWLGGKLEQYADRLKPIDYCIHSKCKFYIDSLKPIYMPYGDKLQKNIAISERELLDLKMMEHSAMNMYHRPIDPHMTVNGRIDGIKRMCVNAILKSAEQYIKVEVDKEIDYPNIVVRGCLYVSKPKV